jgi:hypothetical protein
VFDDDDLVGRIREIAVYVSQNVVNDELLSSASIGFRETWSEWLDKLVVNAETLARLNGELYGVDHPRMRAHRKLVESMKSF